MTEPNAEVTQQRDHLLSNKTYDVLKFIAMILLPAIGTLYFAIAQIWDLPKSTEVLGTITAVDTFLGALLGLSTTSFNNSEAKYDGAIKVIDTPTKTTYSIELNDSPENLTEHQQVLLSVEQPIAPQA